MKIIKVVEVGLDAAAAEAAAVISRGGVVVYPTDTLYGLGVNAFNPHTIERLRNVKGRDKKKPISILAPSVTAIERYAELPSELRTLVEKYLPGALTLVLPAKANVPKNITLNGTIGIRVPNDRFALTLAEMSEHPVTATSANIAGLLTEGNVMDIVMHFGSKIADIDLFVDDGPRKSEPPSTVITYICGTPRILREGAIAKDELGF